MVLIFLIDFHIWKEKRLVEIWQEFGLPCMVFIAFLNKFYLQVGICCTYQKSEISGT